VAKIIIDINGLEILNLVAAELRQAPILTTSFQKVE